MSLDYIKIIFWVLVQDGDVERSWTHLLSWAYQIYSYIQNNFLYKSFFSLSLDIHLHEVYFSFVMMNTEYISSIKPGTFLELPWKYYGSITRFYNLLKWFFFLMKKSIRTYLGNKGGGNGISFLAFPKYYIWRFMR